MFSADNHYCVMASRKNPVIQQNPETYSILQENYERHNIIWEVKHFFDLNSSLRILLQTIIFYRAAKKKPSCL